MCLSFDGVGRTLFRSRTKEDRMDGFMDTGHPRGNRRGGGGEGEVRGEKRIGEGETPSCLEYYFTGHQGALSK